MPSGKLRCFCSSCRLVGGRLLARSTIWKHKKRDEMHEAGATFQILSRSAETVSVNPLVVPTSELVAPSTSHAIADAGPSACRISNADGTSGPGNQEDAITVDDEYFPGLRRSSVDERAAELIQQGLTVDPEMFRQHHRLPAVLRQAYTKALFNRMSGSSFETTDEQLRQDLDLAGSSGGRKISEMYPQQYTERTRTALSHLGADPDGMMTVYMACPACWRLTLLSRLKQLESPVCGNVRIDSIVCDGILFTEHLRLRTPTKVVAYHHLSNALSLLLQDPEIISHLQDWRTGDKSDTTNNFQAPIIQDHNHPYKDENFVMKGFWHGSEWRRQPASVQREVDRRTYEVREPSIGMHPGSRHSSWKYGIKVTLNVDWFHVKGIKNLSVGAVYASIANLPRHLVFKQRSTALLCIIPGPSEPSLTDLNEVLRPIIDNIALCERGIEIEIDSLIEHVEVRVLFTTSDLKLLAS